MVPIFVVFIILLGLILIINSIRGDNKILLGVLVILGILIIPYALFVIGSIIMVLPIPQLDGVCSDISEPKGAIAFAYEHMEVKHNVTFVEIEPNQWEEYCLRHYWVTDTEGTSYRLVWSKMHNDIKLNQSYTIHYLKGLMNPIWEYEPENSS
jgi:hypothetical protein